MTFRTLVPLYSCLALSLAGCELRYDGDCPDSGLADIDTADMPGASCDKGELCLHFDEPLSNDARLGIVWSQLDGDGLDARPSIGLDVPLYSGQRSVGVELSSIARPTDDALFYCARDCDDEASCPCVAEARFATATVFVAADGNEDGRLDAGETGRANGVARVIVGYSEARHSPAPSPLDGIVKGDIEEGVRPYAFVREDDGTWRIRHSDDGRVFSVDTCEDASACDLALPPLGDR